MALSNINLQRWLDTTFKTNLEDITERSTAILGLSPFHPEYGMNVDDFIDDFNDAASLRWGSLAAEPPQFVVR